MGGWEGKGKGKSKGANRFSPFDVGVAPNVKTKMCQHFEMGKCNVNPCSFAHSAAELGKPSYGSGGYAGVLHAMETELEITRHAAAEAQQAVRGFRPQRHIAGYAKPWTPPLK